ncbi:MAG: ribosome maturation factor RimP [Alphaproteobacteria bacterium]|nr:ribosome maturation factor RimP [Alphaproteobacteria bacterium]
MDPAKRVETIITPTLNEMGFDVVRVHLSGAQRQTLQIMAERQDNADMTVEHCAAISRAISALMEVEDPIKGSYTLEVSSPGLDRPLTRPKDFQRFAGLEARVELSRPIEGRKRFRGLIVGLSDDIVQLNMEGQAVDIPFADIDRAKLIMTDELLALGGATRH